MKSRKKKPKRKTKKPAIRWTVPLESGLFFEITISAAHDIAVLSPGPIPMPHLSPLVACQLGQALQEASRVAGGRAARARDRGVRPMPGSGAERLEAISRGR